MTMKKDILKLLLTIFFPAALILMPGCDRQQFYSEETGTGLLIGTIDIGPLCPVETDPPNPDCLPTPETYKAYPVGIWDIRNNHKITTISPETDGSFNIQLPGGNYLIARENEQNGAGGSNLPVTVIIKTGESSFLNIIIDTGIR